VSSPLVKGKVYHITCHEDTEGECRCSFNLYLTSALDKCGWLMPRSRCFNPGNYPVTNVQQAGWIPGAVWRGSNISFPSGSN